MLKVRLKQTGKRDHKGYRIVVCEEHSKRDGRVIESIGHVTPNTHPPAVTVDRARLNHWVSVGAQLSTGARKLIAS